MKNRIAMLRKEQGLNQKELGLKLDVGQTTVSAWETGKNEPDMTALQQLSQLFDVSIGYLIGIDSERWPGGYTNPEYQARIRQRMEDDRREQDILEWQRKTSDGLSGTEIEAIELAELHDRLELINEKLDEPLYIETLEIHDLFENPKITEADRKKIVEIARIVLPR